VGDAITVVVASAETAAGLATAATGALATPETGPVGAAVAAGGVAVASHGVAAATTGALNLSAGLVTMMGRRSGDFSKATKAEIDARNAEQHGGSAACDGCEKPLEKVGNQKGVPTPDNQLQRHHKVPLRNTEGPAGPSTSANAEVLCPDCHKGRHYQK
jgi:hypothetical protein